MAHAHEKQTLRDDYLWDGSGQPDPEIQHLERALARFRHSGSVPPLPAIHAPGPRLGWWAVLPRTTWMPRFAAASLILAAIGYGLWLSHSPIAPPVEVPYGWNVEMTPVSQPDHHGAWSDKKNSRLHLGEILETNAVSKASIAVAEIGRLEVEPLTRLRLLQSAAGRKRIALDRGTIHATIWASPGQFAVDTPSATAIDLGCRYTLQIDDAGNGSLHTTLGWVGFHSNGHDSFIPAGAACATHRQSGPGTPYFEDASEAFRSALAQLDSSTPGSSISNSALETVLREARDRDALTLWHLIPRVSGAERIAVYDRLCLLVPAPAGVTREGILRLDPTMLDSWWNALNLGDISLWRHWEQNWTGREGHTN